MDILSELTSTFAWIGVALALMGAGFAMVDVLTPGHLRTQVTNSVNAVLLVGSNLLAISFIVATAIVTAPDGGLGTALGGAAIYGAIGVVAMAVAFLVLEVAMPGDQRAVVNDTHFRLEAALVATANIAIGIVIAAAIS